MYTVMSHEAVSEQLKALNLSESADMQEITLYVMGYFRIVGDVLDGFDSFKKVFESKLRKLSHAKVDTLRKHMILDAERTVIVYMNSISSLLFDYQDLSNTSSIVPMSVKKYVYDDRKVFRRYISDSLKEVVDAYDATTANHFQFLNI